MSNKANIKNIEDIKDIFFEIPPYQRLYEWNKEQIQTLLNDIKAKFCENNNGENKEYFIGNVVVSKKDNKNNQQDDKYLLIDGQQRLTTLFLIGFFLSYKEYKNWQNFIMQNDKLRISMPIREKEEKVLKEFAKFCNEYNNRENDLFLQKLKEFPQDISQNIPQALEAIVNWFKENIEENTNKFSEFSNFIYSNVKFVFVELAENTDLNRFFIRMNNRGKQLEKHEILKARLLSKINDDKSERTLYAHIWDICSQMDNYIFQKASDRKISKSNKSSGDDEQENIIDKNTIDNIIENDQQKITKKDDGEGKFKSIVDFPTFLLHVYKLTLLEKNQNRNNDKDIIIDKNKLLEFVDTRSIDSKEFIENLLKYRILFDYFVVKGIDDMENSYKIRRLTDNTYTISKDSNEMPNLAMVQNYLRVARSGMSNNHHHWLTPFLKFLYKNIELKIAYDKVGDSDKQELQIKINKFNIITNFQDFLNKLNLSKDIEKLIEFLENLDTALAKEQASTTEQNKNKKDLLEISNEVFITLEIKDKQMSVEDTFFNNEDIKDIKDLDQGTATPHYWFYRLEYYLWKNAEVENDKVKICDKEMNRKKFDSFYFRNLNSIEHVQAQSKANENDWNNEKINNFGNLALISSSFNSSLNNQDVQDKYLDLQKYINKDNVISLKLWLIYALSEKNQSKWTSGKAEEHKKQMLEILKNSFKAI
ncbi:DUF262 domain-containing protein [Campylobacter volucris]|uniref:DUF262 domain-containing protein n=1 Tax=Campylobacter volucris TaxID=1031542 RepID=UPI0018A0F242|nr:DUF262 domain-containing protein [Campylobacter volucris]MBF7046817.1 DUF262 domain-containing protein [Campylobacter volucris]